MFLQGLAYGVEQRLRVGRLGGLELRPLQRVDEQIPHVVFRSRATGRHGEQRVERLGALEDQADIKRLKPWLNCRTQDDRARSRTSSR